jgi:glycosyltransferase involved in cell wall biosynthesis
MAKRLKIGFDAKRLFCNFTGLGNYARTLVKNLEKHFPEHEYHLFTTKVLINEETEPFLNGKFHIHTPSLGINSGYWRTYGQSKLANSLDLDVYHGLSHELPFGLSGSVVKVVTFHDLIWEIYPNQFGLFDRLGYRLKYKSAAYRADRVISISKSTAKDLKRIYNVPESKIDIVYQTCNEQFTLQPNHKNSRDYFLYVGSIIPRKGLYHVIEAFASLHDQDKKPFVVIGIGPKGYTVQCKNLIKEYHLEPYFQFVGNVNNDELVSYYDGAIALILPSIYEGFGIPIIEAMARFCPVVTSNVSSLPEASGPHNIQIDPNDITQLYKAISRLSRTVSSIDTAQSNEYFHKHFDGLKLSNQLMDIYQANVEAKKS